MPITTAPSRPPPRLPLDDVAPTKSHQLAEAVAREASQHDGRKSQFRPPSTWSHTTAEVLWTGDDVVPPMPLTPASATFSLGGGSRTNGASSLDGEDDDFADAPSWDGPLDPKASGQADEGASTGTDSDAWRMSQFGADQSTFGHARNSSVGSSVWAGKGAIDTEDAPPMPNLASNPQYMLHSASSGLPGTRSPNGLAGASSVDRRKSFESSSDYSAGDDLPHAATQKRTGFQRDWKMPQAAPSPSPSASAEAAALEADEALDGFDIIAPASGVASSVEGSSELPGGASRPKMPPIPSAKSKNIKRKQQGRKNRSPVLSYADGEEAEEGMLAKQTDGEGLQRMASLGPKLKKNSPAPWELDDTAASAIPSNDSSSDARPSSDRMQSTYARLRGVASGRPSGDASSSRGRDPVPISPGARTSTHRGSTPSLISASADADRSAASTTPTGEGSGISSIFTSARSRSKSVSSAAGGMLKGLGLGGGSNSATPGANSPLVQVPPPLPIASSSASIHDKSVSRKSKFVKAFRKAAGDDDKKAPLSLAAGISSEDYKDLAPYPDSSDAQGQAHSQAIQSQLDQQAVAQQAMMNSLQQHAASLGAPSPSAAGSLAVSPYATPAGDRSPSAIETNGLSTSASGTSLGGDYLSNGSQSGYTSPLPPASPISGPGAASTPGTTSTAALQPPQRSSAQRRVSDAPEPTGRPSTASSQQTASPVMQPSNGPLVPRTLSLSSSANSMGPVPTSLPPRGAALTPPPVGRSAEPMGRVVSSSSMQSNMSRTGSGLSYKRSSSFIEPGMVPSRQQTMSPPVSGGTNSTSLSQQQQQPQQPQPRDSNQQLRDNVTSPNRRNLILRSDESALDGSVPPGVHKVTNSAYYSSDGFGGYVRQRKNSSGQMVSTPVTMADAPPVPTLPSAQQTASPPSMPSSPPSSHPTPMNMPRPGAHEAAGYKLISLEQARLNQQRAQAAERAAGRIPASESSSNGGGVSPGGGEGGGHRTYPSESGSTGAMSGRPLKSKKSGFMRIFNNKDKNGERIEGEYSGEYGKASEESDSVGMMPSFNASRGGLGQGSGGEIDAPALSLRPMSSMFAGFGADLLDTTALAADEGFAASPSSPSGLAPPSSGPNGLLAPSAPSSYASSRASSGVYEDAGPASTYGSPSSTTPARPTAAAAALPNGDIEPRQRRKTGPSSAVPPALNGRPASIAESTHSDASSLGGAANGFPLTPLGAPQTPGPAWRARAIELETRIAEMAAELTKIRTSHMAGNDELPLGDEGAPPTLEEQMQQSVSSIIAPSAPGIEGASASTAASGAQTPAANASSPSATTSVSAPSLNEPQTPLSEMGAIPPCAFCGCGCAEHRRAKAVNEMAVLKGLSVLARGRPLQPGNGAGSRFGSHTNRL